MRNQRNELQKQISDFLLKTKISFIFSDPLFYPSVMYIDRQYGLYCNYTTGITFSGQ